MIKISNWKRIVAVLKFTLVRGYSYCSTITIGIIGATSIKPYLDQYIVLHLWQLIFIALGAFMVIGIFDRVFNIIGEEQAYLTERNKTMMKGLYDKDGNKNGSGN